MTVVETAHAPATRAPTASMADPLEASALPSDSLGDGLAERMGVLFAGAYGQAS